MLPPPRPGRTTWSGCGGQGRAAWTSRWAARWTSLVAPCPMQMWWPGTNKQRHSNSSARRQCTAANCNARLPCPPPPQAQRRAWVCGLWTVRTVHGTLLSPRERLLVPWCSDLAAVARGPPGWCFLPTARASLQRLHPMPLPHPLGGHCASGGGGEVLPVTELVVHSGPPAFAGQALRVWWCLVLLHGGWV